MSNPVSDCCEAPMKVGGEGETHYYICTKCEKPCDAYTAEEDCPECNGVGYFAGHAEGYTHSPDGECTVCPVQIPCKACSGTGQVEVVWEFNLRR